MAGPVREPAADHARLQREVQPGGQHRLVEARHDDDLVHERVVPAPPPADLLPQRPLLRLAEVIDDQDLEIRALRRGLVRPCVSRPRRPRPQVDVPAGRCGRSRPPGPGSSGSRSRPAGRTSRPRTAAGPAGRQAGRETPRNARPARGVEQFLHRSVRLDRRAGRGPAPAAARLLQPGPGIAPELAKPVVRVRALRHGNHLRDVPAVVGPAPPTTRPKVTIYPRSAAGHKRNKGQVPVARA